MIRIALHLMPLVPIFYERYVIAIATALLVALMYIKRYKIENQREMHRKILPDPTLTDKYIEDYDKRIGLLKKLTFELPWRSNVRD